MRVTWEVGFGKQRHLEFADSDRVADEPINRLSDIHAKAFAATVERGTRAAQGVLAVSYETRGGILKRKTLSMRKADLVQLQTLVEILDHAFHWRGAWGQNQGAIHSELYRRATEGRPA